MIVPLNFPSAIDVSDPYLARLVSLEEMKHWEWAPYNAGKVAEAGIPMALTMHGVSKGKDFVANLRKAVEHGLSAQDALAALTTVPASMIGAEDRVGRIAPGLEANFIIADGPFFENGTALRATVVQGVRHDVDTEPEADVAGRYSLNLDGRDLVLELKTGDKGPSGRWWPVGTEEEAIDSLAGKAKVTLDGRDLVLRVLDEEDGAFRLVGNVYEGSRIIEGRGERPDGTWIEWAALRQGDGGPRPKRSRTPKQTRTWRTPARSLVRIRMPWTLQPRMPVLWPPDRSRIRSLRTDEPTCRTRGRGISSARRSGPVGRKAKSKMGRSSCTRAASRRWGRRWTLPSSSARTSRN